MSEKPILFSDPMVRAILSGQKTQTRRVVKPQPEIAQLLTHSGWSAWHDEKGHPLRNPYGQPGDRLWVREAHAIVPRTAYRASTGVHQVLRPDDDHDAAVFRADWERSAPSRWKPSIHMPRWACRLVLEIVSIRVERLQDISEADAEAEGVERLPEAPRFWKSYRFGKGIASSSHCESSASAAFRTLWQSINGAESWDANPWVWVIEFRRVQL